MAETTGIEWCHATFNPWRGCTRVSEGCRNCYAATLSKRNPGTLGVWGPEGTRVVAAESSWRQPLKWNREAEAAGERRGVFCASLADVFEDWRGPMTDSAGRTLYLNGEGWHAEGPPGERLTMNHVRRRLVRLVGDTRFLDYLVLTKRPENVPTMMATVADSRGLDQHSIRSILGSRVACPALPSNLWLGASIEDQFTTWRLHALSEIPASVRFVSVEPLLGPVDLTRCWDREERRRLNALAGRYDTGAQSATGRVDWVIVGGESGPGARPCRVECVRSIVKQCQSASVPCLVKQLGANVVDGADGRVRLRDRKGGDMSEWPANLRVREFPR